MIPFRKEEALEKGIGKTILEFFPWFSVCRERKRMVQGLFPGPPVASGVKKLFVRAGNEGFSA